MKAYVIAMVTIQTIAGLCHLYDFTAKQFPMERRPITFGEIKAILIIQWGLVLWGLWVL